MYKRQVAIPLEMTSFKSRQGEFPITEKTPVTLTFTIIGVNKAKVTGTAELTLSLIHICKANKTSYMFFCG